MHNNMLGYAKGYMTSLADVYTMDDMPMVNAVMGETDYCGMLIVYDIGGIEKCSMLLSLDSITEYAEYYGLDMQEAIGETVYHEWMHYINWFLGDSPTSHGGEFWEDMLTIGIDRGFINRRDI